MAASRLSSLPRARASCRTRCRGEEEGLDLAVSWCSMSELRTFRDVFTVVAAFLSFVAALIGVRWRRQALALRLAAALYSC